MSEIAMVLCVGALIATVFVRGYTVKEMDQKRRDCGMLLREEKRLRQECEQIEILQESAEARRSQAQMDVEKFRVELEELIPEISSIETELDKAHKDEDDR